MVTIIDKDFNNKYLKWDIRFLNLCKHISNWSKDPSTKVGAVIVNSDNKRIISLGYNGFPNNVIDDEHRYNNREIKYKLIQHAETNAILFSHQNLNNSTIYVYPMFPCIRCAGMIIQAGIKNIVSIELNDDLKQRWSDDFDLTNKIFKEAGINFFLYSLKYWNTIGSGENE